MKKYAFLSAIIFMAIFLVSCGGPSLPGNGIFIINDENEFDINLINEPMQSNAWAIYNRNYTVDGKEVFNLKIPSGDDKSNEAVIEVSCSTKKDEFSYRVEKIHTFINDSSGTEYSFDIPASGFLIRINYSDKKIGQFIKSAFIERQTLKLRGYEEYQAAVPIEDDSAGYITVNIDDVTNDTRKINLKNTNNTTGNSIILYDSFMSGNLPSAEDFMLVRFKAGSRMKEYSITEVEDKGKSKSSVKIEQNELVVLLKGNYNEEYAKKYYTKETKVIIGNLNKTSNVAEYPALMCGDGTVVSVNDINTQRPADGYMIYNMAYSNKETPAGSGFIDIVVANNIVAEIKKENTSSKIPLNGYVISLSGSAKSEVVKFKPGDVIYVSEINNPIYPEIYVKYGDYILPVDGLNAARSVEGMACVYDPRWKKPTTETNIWGWEVIVENNIITAIVATSIEGTSGNSAIPQNGFVVSVHASHTTFGAELNKMQVGDKIELFEGKYDYNILSYDLTSVNPKEKRGTGEISVYTEAGFKTLFIDDKGYDIVVDSNGNCAELSEYGEVEVPDGGYVISYNGSAYANLKRYFKAGAPMSLDLINNKLYYLVN